MNSPPTDRASVPAGIGPCRSAVGPTGRRLALPAAVAVTVLLSACQIDGGVTSPATSTPTSTPASATPESTSGTPTSTAMATPRPSIFPSATPQSTPADVTIAVVIADGKVSPNAENVRVKAGQTVQVTLTSDVEESIHVHGYNQTAAATPDEPGTVSFTAEVKGVFEIETHESAKLVAKLVVS